MSEYTDDDDVFAIHICERCGEPLQGRYPNEELANQPSPCGICGVGPTTRVFGAVEPYFAVHDGAKAAGCRRQVVECYRIRDTDRWDLYLALNITQTAPDDADVRDDPIIAIGDSLAEIGYASRVSHNPNGLDTDDEDEDWDSQIKVRVRYPEEDVEEMTTFWEFLDEDPEKEASQ